MTHAARPKSITRHARIQHLHRAARHLSKQIHRWDGVVGVGVGTKYAANKPTDDHFAIRVFVRRKGPKKKQALPAYVHGRNARNRPVRRLRFQTDVLEVGRIKACCGAGSRIRSVPGSHGTISLMFRDKNGADGQHFVISCAHVLSRVTPSPIERTLLSECRDQVTPFADLVYSSVKKDDLLPFDIGIACVEKSCLPVPDCMVIETPYNDPTQLVGVFPAAKIAPNLHAHCWMPVSGNREARVDAFPSGWVEVDYGYATCRVGHVFAVRLNKSAERGDSGSLIFSDQNEAIGILFASMEGAPASGEAWGWCHPFEDALQHINTNINTPVKCFN
jgi:hypothetical protein